MKGCQQRIFQPAGESLMDLETLLSRFIVKSVILLSNVIQQTVSNKSLGFGGVGHYNTQLYPCPGLDFQKD